MNMLYMDEGIDDGWGSVVCFLGRQLIEEIVVPFERVCGLYICICWSCISVYVCR